MNYEIDDYFLSFYRETKVILVHRESRVIEVIVESLDHVELLV